MLPGISGFHWSFGHVLFISIFLTVLSVVGVTLIAALAKSRRAIKAGRVEAIRWHSDFHELPAADRACRHNITGEAPGRVCPNEFECGHCGDYHKYVAHVEECGEEHFGLRYPGNRYYHRGHTWVEPSEDGTVLIGLDPIARHLVGQPDRMLLPATGSKLELNAPAWRMWKDGQEVRVLAPVDGEVVETGAPDSEWQLRVRPAASPSSLRHLLRGAEVRAWVGRELERLQMMFSPAGAQPTLADGGVLVPDLIRYAPAGRRDEILGSMFLEP